MRLVMIVAATLALWFVATGCGSNACEDACEKQKSCIGNLDCSTLDPTAQAGCEMTKQLLGQADCSAAADSCSGQNEEAAKLVNSCELDPATCSCK